VTGLLVESVEIYFTADHSNWGDLMIVLASSSGTTSILAEKHDTTSSTSSYDNWRFGSERHLGEFSAGDWSLTVRDLGTKGGGTFSNWKIVIYGTEVEKESAVRLDVVASPSAGGAVSPSNAMAVPKGVQIALESTASPDFFFIGWEADPDTNVEFGDRGAKSEKTTASLSGDATITALFSKTSPKTANVVWKCFPSTGGFTDSMGTTMTNTGSTLRLTALPYLGNSFARWSASPSENVAFANDKIMDTFATVNGDAEITARFLLPDVLLTLGSTVVAQAADFEMGTFARPPAMTGTVENKMHRLKTVGKYPNPTATAIWPGKPKIYDPATYKKPPQGLGLLLDNDPMQPLELSSLGIVAKPEGAELDVTDFATCAVAPPRIRHAFGNPEAGAEIRLYGFFFGTKPPRVSIEYVRNGKYSRKPCKVVRDFSYLDALGKPSCMDPNGGTSELDAIYPKLPKGAEPTGYVIIENRIGMGSKKLVPVNQ
jgi:subtilisin-like proprotein convertase family protein